MEQLRIQLRSVFYREGRVWFSHCLEMDVLGHGSSRLGAFKMMLDAIVTQVANSVESENRANIFMPADGRFFEMYSAGKDLVDSELIVEVERLQHDYDHVTLDRFESREYAGDFVMA